MYICNNCGAVFDTPDTQTESHPYGEGYAQEKWSVCPCCGDNDFDEAKECRMCGELVSELNEGLCDCCYGDVYGE